MISTWNKQKYASGYHVRVSESSDFEAAKTYQFTVAGTKYTSMAFKDTKSDTKYYVKIRSYRDSKYGRAYGAWSK